MSSASMRDLMGPLPITGFRSLRIRGPHFLQGKAALYRTRRRSAVWRATGGEGWPPHGKRWPPWMCARWAAGERLRAGEAFGVHRNGPLIRYSEDSGQMSPLAQACAPIRCYPAAGATCFTLGGLEDARPLLPRLPPAASSRIRRGMAAAAV